MVRTMLKAFALLAPGALLFACSSTSSTGPTSASSGSGAHPTTSSASTSGSSSGGGNGGATTSSGSTTASGSSSSSGSTGGACTDSADQMALATHQSTIAGDAQTCTIQNLGNQPGASTCLQMKDGLSKACADCFAADGTCGATNCFADCSGGVSAACSACLDMHCTPAFDTCSGISGSPPVDGGDGG